MDRAGLTVVPEATPAVAEDGTQPAEQAAPDEPAAADHVQTARARTLAE
jgi:hypothetical protein